MNLILNKACGLDNKLGNITRFFSVVLLFFIFSSAFATTREYHCQINQEYLCSQKHCKTIQDEDKIILKLEGSKVIYSRCLGKKCRTHTQNSIEKIGGYLEVHVDHRQTHLKLDLNSLEFMESVHLGLTGWLVFGKCILK